MASGMVPLAEHSRYGKYFRMLRVGLPRPAVLSRMRVDGVDERLLDRDPTEPVPESPLPSALFGKSSKSQAGERSRYPDLPYLAKIGDYAAIAERLEAADAREVVNSRDRRGNTPLILAVHGNHLEVAALLLQRGADTELESYVRPIAAVSLLR